MHRASKINLKKVCLLYQNDNNISSSHFTENVQLLALCILPHLLPLCGRKLKDGGVDEESTSKQTGETSVERPQRAKKVPARLLEGAIVGERKKATTKTTKANLSDCLGKLIVFREVCKFISEVIFEAFCLSFLYYCDCNILCRLCRRILM